MAYREDIEYIKVPPEDDPVKIKDYLEIGKGLQATDGLPTSHYLDQVINEAANGSYDISQAQEKLKDYYAKIDPASDEYATKEGDEVTARIAEVLESYSFTFSPITLQGIHRQLFEGIKPDFRPGEWRDYNFIKKEPILNGRSVNYGDWNAILAQLDHDFGQERSKQQNYRLPLDAANIDQLAGFISRVWETHGFCEGNTRTSAVFLILYLRRLGVPANNDYFKGHSAYFRDALVRSNYTSLENGVSADTTYLKKFFENMLLGANYDLESLDLRCHELFSHNDQSSPSLSQQVRAAECASRDRDLPDPPRAGIAR